MNDVLEEFNILTRTEETESKYYERALQLVKKAKRELNISRTETIDPRQLVMWLENHKKNIKSASWRKYKASMIYYLSTYVTSQEGREAVSYLREVTSIGTLKHTTNTSAQKMKKIPLKDWELLKTYLESIPGKWNQPLIYWIESSILTGLRPIEWKNALLVNYAGEIALKVENAKNTNGRSHGQYRHLVLSNLTSEELKSIKQHLNNIRTFSGLEEYDYFYRGCKTTLYKANRKIWRRRSKHITLYSSRHQFTANAKSGGLRPEEIAALMGHAVDNTNIEHYGRKSAGQNSSKVKPISIEIEKVKKNYSHFDWNKYKESGSKDLIS